MSDLGLDELWIRCFGLGGLLGVVELRATLDDERRPTSCEHDVIAQALNEYFLDCGLPRTVIYSEGLDNPHET